MVELRRTRSHISVSSTTWMLTIEFARVCGWNPCGTRQQTEMETVDALQDVRHLMAWQTEYLSNEGQTVTAPDASQLAEALQRAAKEGDRILIDWTEGRSTPPEDVRTTPGSFRWFCTADGRHHLNNLINFCRGGAFQIF